jgi:hypothetical protein
MGIRTSRPTWASELAVRRGRCHCRSAAVNYVECAYVRDLTLRAQADEWRGVEFFLREKR